MEHEYKPNSRLSKEREREAAKQRENKKVVSGGVRTRENKSRKFLGTFIAGDKDSVWDTVLMDVLVPSLKKLISEGITTAADLFIYGETRGRSKSSDRVSYRRYYDDRDRERDRERRDSERRSGARSRRFDYDDLIFDTRGDAESVLDKMQDTIAEFGLVSVADMYDFADLSAPFTSHDYGWMSLRSAGVKRVHDGYILDLPKFMPLR